MRGHGNRQLEGRPHPAPSTQRSVSQSQLPFPAGNTRGRTIMEGRQPPCLLGWMELHSVRQEILFLRGRPCRASIRRRCSAAYWRPRPAAYGTAVHEDQGHPTAKCSWPWHVQAPLATHPSEGSAVRLQERDKGSSPQEHPIAPYLIQRQLLPHISGADRAPIRSRRFRLDPSTVGQVSSDRGYRGV